MITAGTQEMVNQSSEHITETIGGMETELSYPPLHFLPMPGMTLLKVHVHYSLNLQAEHLLVFALCSGKR